MTLPSSSNGRICNSWVTCSKNKPSEAAPGMEMSLRSDASASDHSQTDPDSPSPMPSSVTMIASCPHAGQKAAAAACAS